MDNSLSKVNQISHLATKSVDEKKINLLKKHNNNDLGIVADQFESIFVYFTSIMFSDFNIDSYNLSIFYIIQKYIDTINQSQIFFSKIKKS